MADITIQIDHVSKNFRLPHEKHSSIKSTFINFSRRRKGYELQNALDNVSLQISKGEFFGIVGRNGSGKSTLLKLLAGIYVPDRGAIQVNGKLTPFIELGVGFNPELTGRENVYLNGALLGFSRKEMGGLYKDIVEFAELDKFMDQKLKNYSSGMQVRLAFSIAIRAHSDILLIDEVLAVGDLDFQRKCFDVFHKIKHTPRTVIFVSHDLNSIEEFCDRAALIDNGRLLAVDKPADIVVRYKSLMAKSAKDSKESDGHKGTGDVLITKLDIISKNKPVKQLKADEPFIVRINYQAKKIVQNPVFGLAIVDENGVIVTGPNTSEVDFKLGSVKGKGYVDAKFENNPLVAGRYTFMVSCYDEGISVPYDFVNQIGRVYIIGKERHGIIDLRPKWSTDR